MAAKKILLVDDEKDYTTLMQEHLEGITDFEVYTASNGRQGLDTAKKIKPDLIILDIVMPGMDGFEVLEKLKNNTSTMGIPVIMLSARDDDNSKIRAAQLYNEMYLTKPIDANKLKAKINEVLGWRDKK